VTADVGVTLLEELAANPRFIGTQALARARDRCAEALSGLGYSVTLQPFTFSDLPARFGMPAIGGFTVLLIGSAWELTRNGQPTAALATVVGGCVATAAGSRWLASPEALRLAGGEIRGVNLEARPRDVMPRVWLVAHLDSKSQPLPLALRALAVSIVIAAWCGAVLFGLGFFLGVKGASLDIPFVLSIVGGAPLLLASISGYSPGAVDNASGVAVVLGAAQQLLDRRDVGILITDAEEAGLAGAHAWVCGRPAGIALNCDTVDDSGTMRALWSGARPATTSAAVARAARSLGLGCKVQRLPRGILTDGVAFQRAGWDCLTISRATWRTLGRIHTRRDSLYHLEGRGLAAATALLVASVRQLQ
jgi:hypothetical protein